MPLIESLGYREIRKLLASPEMVGRAYKALELSNRHNLVYAFSTWRRPGDGSMAYTLIEPGESAPSPGLSEGAKDFVQSQLLHDVGLVTEAQLKETLDSGVIDEFDRQAQRDEAFRKEYGVRFSAEDVDDVLVEGAYLLFDVEAWPGKAPKDTSRFYEGGDRCYSNAICIVISGSGDAILSQAAPEAFSEKEIASPEASGYLEKCESSQRRSELKFGADKKAWAGLGRLKGWSIRAWQIEGAEGERAA